MTTSKTQATRTNGNQISSDELPQDHPLKAASESPNAGAVQVDWQAKAQQTEGEARFWKQKYFEALQYSQSQSQVIAALARPQLEQDAKQQAELLAKFAGIQADS